MNRLSLYPSQTIRKEKPEGLRGARPFRLAFACLLALFGWASSLQAVTISGVVFHDRNANGVQDPREPRLARVAVSDGRDVVVTAREGNYQLETEPGRFVFISLPKGYRAAKSFYVRVGSETHIHFPLLAWPESNKDTLRFVQVSDTHVTASEEVVRTFVEDIEEINTLAPEAAFALGTGDLVNVGKNTNEYEGYVRGIASFKIPYFNIPGNHDAISEEGLQHYHHYLGPDYYSLNAGNCHFIFLNSMRFDAEVQKAWIEKDLAAAPKKATRIFAFHYLPTQSQLEYLAGLGASAILSGHWHGNRVRESHGVLDINTPPLRFGGIDRHPRSFRIIDVNRGKLDNELRLGGFKHHCVVVSPSGTAAPKDGKLPVVVNAYDSRFAVENVEFELAGKRIRLKRASLWTWMGEISAADSMIEPQTITAHVRAANGETWKQSAQFKVQPEGPEERSAFQLKWAASTGGFIGLSSPKAGQECIAVGVDDKGNLKNCGVSAFNEKGEKLWHFKTDSAIKNNVSSANGRIYATSVAGWLYALNESSGKLIWKVELDRKRERWEVAATVVADGVVYVGRRSYIAAFKEKTGQRLWEGRHAPNDWWPSSYTIPTVADGKLLLHARQGALALDIRDGQVAWQTEGRFNGCLATNGTAYTIMNDSLSALSLADGKVMWSRKAKIGDTASMPALVDDKLIVGTASGGICALSVEEGNVLWNFQTGKSLSSLQPYKRDESDVNSSPAILGGNVYVGASDGYVYALSLATGEKVGSYQLGVPIASSPLIHEGTLYIGAYDGNLYAFQLNEP